jgi:hypothetical protein
MKEFAVTSPEQLAKIIEEWFDSDFRWAPDDLDGAILEWCRRKWHAQERKSHHAAEAGD